MYKVLVDKQCDCFQKSDLKMLNEFEKEDDACDFTIKMRDIMNSEFCSKHSFQVLKIFDNFKISLIKPLDNSLKCCESGCCQFIKKNEQNDE